MALLYNPIIQLFFLFFLVALKSIISKLYSSSGSSIFSHAALHSTAAFLTSLFRSSSTSHKLLTTLLRKGSNALSFTLPGKIQRHRRALSRTLAIFSPCWRCGCCCCLFVVVVVVVVVVVLLLSAVLRRRLIREEMWPSTAEGDSWLMTIMLSIVAALTSWSFRSKL